MPSISGIFQKCMEASNSENKTEDHYNMALIVPQYVFDPATHDLVQPSGENEVSTILDHVSIQNGVCSIEDSDAVTNPSDTGCDVYNDASPHFIGDSRRIIDIYTALYENHAISNVIHLIRVCLIDRAAYWEFNPNWR